MCGCSSYANMSGNSYIGLTPPAPKYGNAAGTEDKITTTATKVGETAEKAGGVLGQIKSVTDVFTGKTSPQASSEASPEKQDKKVYLYAIGGLLLVVAIIFAIKKLS